MLCQRLLKSAPKVRYVQSIGISILGTRMNADYQDIKSYKTPNICENLCPNLMRRLNFLHRFCSEDLFSGTTQKRSGHLLHTHHQADDLIVVDFVHFQVPDDSPIAQNHRSLGHFESIFKIMCNEYDRKFSAQFL